MNPIQFILALHNHQPVGNFDWVLQEACQRAYQPLLEMLERYPEITLCMHYSGGLLEWINAHRSEHFQKLRLLVQRGQVEILGGGFYEPILVMLPEHDRLGQIRSCSQWLKENLGQEPRGIWLAERVWEQSLVKTLSRAGVAYTVVDDSHFRHAGLEEEDLDGYFLTEDEGELLRVFPASERLRYYIPFEHPQKTIDYLLEVARRRPGAIMVYADDGEKFGLWPKTFRHVYEDGWLGDFFKALLQNRQWLRLTTFSQALSTSPPRGKIYLPDASYREMMEWALPLKGIHEYEEVSRALQAQPWGGLARRFLKGGSWRNFRVKYPEAYQMYARMLEVSGKVASMDRASSGLPQAQRELYKAQCNDAYWHGIFGGLYLPHLRSAVFKHLLMAEFLAQPSSGTSLEAHDYDLDTREELKLSNTFLNAYVKPDRGGHLYELDYKPRGLNLLNTLTRRQEAYHKKILDSRPTVLEGGVKSIHELAPRVEEELKKHLLYDHYQREGLIDHFFPRGACFEDFLLGRLKELGDFVSSPFSFRSTAGGLAQLEMERIGTLLVDGELLPMRVAKRLEVDGLKPVLLITYVLENVSARVLKASFGVEFNISLSEAGRYYLPGGDAPGGQLTQEASLLALKGLSLVDEGLGVGLDMECNLPAEIWLMPLMTVSQCESGFDKVYQGSCILLRWDLGLGPQDSWRMEIKKTLREIKSL